MPIFPLPSSTAVPPLAAASGVYAPAEAPPAFSRIRAHGNYSAKRSFEVSRSVGSKQHLDMPEANAEPLHLLLARGPCIAQATTCVMAFEYVPATPRAVSPTTPRRPLADYQLDSQPTYR
jgi:hypothetical protein